MIDFPSFDDTAELFMRYESRYLDRTKAEWPTVAEVHARLNQLDWFLNRISSLHDEMGLIDQRYSEQEGSPEEFNRKANALIDKINETQLMTEGFYLFAWRLIVVLRFLPYLKGFDCKPINRVRNCLIEHPEKCKGFYTGAFTINADIGPVLSPTSETIGYRDEGLVPNSKRFHDRLNRRFTTLIKARPAKVRALPADLHLANSSPV